MLALFLMMVLGGRTVGRTVAADDTAPPPPPPPPNHAQEVAELSNTNKCKGSPHTKERPCKRPRKRPRLAALEPGIHVLADGAVCTYVRNAITATTAEFEELWNMFPQAEKNPMNRNTLLRRLQMTFGFTYEFSGQTSPNMGRVDTDSTPSLIQQAVNDARARARDAGHDTSLYTFVHCNGYPDGNAGLMYHQDNEDSMAKGLPIYSYTFIVQADAKGFHYRDFCVSTSKNDTGMIARIETHNGDLVVMAGTFQQALYHGIKKTASMKASQLQRINLTVRPLAKPLAKPSSDGMCACKPPFKE
jgi:alkylated DNA repair dioxygenase AlkB